MQRSKARRSWPAAGLVVGVGSGVGGLAEEGIAMSLDPGAWYSTGLAMHGLSSMVSLFCHCVAHLVQGIVGVGGRQDPLTHPPEALVERLAPAGVRAAARKSPGAACAESVGPASCSPAPAARSASDRVPFSCGGCHVVSGRRPPVLAALCEDFACRLGCYPLLACGAIGRCIAYQRCRSILWLHD